MRISISSTANDFMAFICSQIHIHHPQHTFSKKTSTYKHVINRLNFIELSPGQYTPLLTLTLRGNKEIQRKRHSKSRQLSDETEIVAKWDERCWKSGSFLPPCGHLGNFTRRRKRACLSSPWRASVLSGYSGLLPHSETCMWGHRWIGYP